MNDAANYTNRSPYPMLHILREESVSRAVDSYPHAEKIPQKNIAFARQKGLAYMQRLLAACMEIKDWNLRIGYCSKMIHLNCVQSGLCIEPDLDTF